MNLSELLYRLPEGLLAPVGPAASGDLPVADIAYDSRGVGRNSIFVAARGVAADGHRFLLDAARAGAVALVGEDAAALGAAATPRSPAFLTRDSRRALAELANALYHQPSREMDVIGVTGTNGKTTTVHLIERLHARLGFRTGRIGTLGVLIGGEVTEGLHTTPEAPDLQRALRRMADAGTQKVPIEVSSHALAQHRVWGTRFCSAVFTNLTQDHLDYHGDMEDYFAAKRRLFTEYGVPRAVMNVDDPYALRLVADFRGEALLYGLGEAADLRARDVRATPSGSRFTLEYRGRRRGMRLRMAGVFNVSNALAAIGAAMVEGADFDRIADEMEQITGAPGRFESVDRGQEFTVLVDYAHTPDALMNVLRAAREITPGRLLVVFGCGGDRDRSKRPIMGGIGGRLADAAYITSDNPRTEEPGAILDDIITGVEAGARYTANPDRRAAIFAAISDAGPGDTVVIAGKGHEDYQIVGAEKRHFDDREVAAEALEQRMHGSR